METSVVVALLVLGALVVVIGGVALVFVLGAGVWFARRGPKIDPEARAKALAELGYAPVKATQWRRQFRSTAIVFDDLPDGPKWTVRLPRYNTMTVRVEERASVASGARSAPPKAFEWGNAALDERFAVGSELPARVQALVKNKTLQKSLLGVPNLSLDLGADELVVTDPGRAGLASLVGDAAPGTEKAVAAEVEQHQAVSALVLAFFDVVYSTTGTVFDEFR